MRWWLGVGVWLMAACPSTHPVGPTHVRTIRDGGSEARIAGLDADRLVIATRSAHGAVSVETIDARNRIDERIVLGPDALVGRIAAHRPYVALSLALRAPSQSADSWTYSVRLFRGDRELWAVPLKGHLDVDTLSVDALGVVAVAGTFWGTIRAGERVLTSVRNPPTGTSLHVPLERFSARLSEGAAAGLEQSDVEMGEIGCAAAECQWPAVAVARADSWMARVVSLNQPRVVNGLLHTPGAMGPRWLVLVLRTGPAGAEVARAIEVDAGWISVEVTPNGTIWMLASCAPEAPRIDGTTPVRCGENDVALLRL